MNTTTLDERIREKALNDYKEQVKAAFRPVMALFQLGNATRTSIEGPKGDYSHHVPGEESARKFFSAHALLNACADALIERKSVAVQDEAVAAFLRKVEELDARVDQLRNEAGY